MKAEEIQEIKNTDLFKAVYARDVAGHDWSSDDEEDMINDIVTEIHDARKAVALYGADPEEILEDTFGLEPDYIFDLMP